ncbi:anti-lipopolysaccharide factor-like [Penaeus chinensis]|uniref:Antilipopolysaccharide factor isoform 8 n=1 Tax=Penaeus chinensis TaxID=139456 RepID=A0A4P9IX27_PENCE|nr:anti-lipopolysaccharide factor-like [Penaeus chinensis]QCU72940.1 antilipopolysaccharide factor isoform 8 [Penaeus chinensis]QCU72941.1 antilipopolysaccharide factor isoform 8 [Penaeus chinensis]
MMDQRPWALIILFLLTATSVKLLSAQEVEEQENYVSDILSKIYNTLIRNGEFELLGHYCSYSTRPYFIRWQLKFKTKIWCPGWTLVYGTARDKASVSNSLQDAIVNFVQKAHQEGVINEEDAKPWLQKKQ